MTEGVLSQKKLHVRQLIEPWTFYGPDTLKKALESEGVPEDLKQVFDRYIEMYSVANGVHKAIKAMWFQGKGEVSLRFDTDGSIVGAMPLDVVVKMWSEKTISGVDDEDPAILFTAEYSGPAALVIEEAVVDSVNALYELLEPLRDAGWVASITKVGEEYHLEAILTYAALMRDAEVS